MADYAVIRPLHVAVGGEYHEDIYSPGQVLRNTQDVESWGKVSVTPATGLESTLKYGERIAQDLRLRRGRLCVRGESTGARFQLCAARPGFLVAHRLLVGDADTHLDPRGVAGQGRPGPRRWDSRVPMSSGARATLSWSPRETLSAYIDAGYQRLFTLQDGFTGPGTAPWLTADTERFWRLTIGGRWTPQRRWTLALDYLRAPSLPELFPTTVRYTGCSLAFNFAGIFGASLAPYIATWLAKHLGLQYVGYYLCAAAFITFCGLLMMPETKDGDFAADDR